MEYNRRLAEISELEQAGTLDFDAAHEAVEAADRALKEAGNSAD